MASPATAPAYGPLIDNAARRYNVPVWILIGIFGMETSFGSNVTTSSAGAKGLMQFIPSTARSYNYPLTNNPNQAQAQQQFDAAAHYLSNLYHQTGSWNSAIQHYSGGGYGLSQVQQQVKSSTGQSIAKNVALGPHGFNTPGVTPGPGTVGSIVPDVGGAITGVFNQAVSDLKYGLVLLVAVGAGAYLLIKGTTGKSPAEHAQNLRMAVAPE